MASHLHEQFARVAREAGPAREAPPPLGRAIRPNSSGGWLVASHLHEQFARVAREAGPGPPPK